jgi:predicted ATPase
VGRTGLVAVIDDALLALPAGSGRAVLLRGDPGAGKTRLLSEVADHAGERGFQVFWGRCFQVGEAEPYGLWRGVLRSIGVTIGTGQNRHA